MPSWRDDYFRALRDRDEKEQASLPRLDGEYIEAYTSLLDQVSHLNATLALQTSPSSALGNPTKPTATKTPSPHSGSPAPPAPPAPENAAQLKADLTDALRSNTQLQSRIKTAEGELVTLRKRTKEDRKTIEGLGKQVAMLERKVKDRDEELREKGRGFSDVQDEMISLNLQVNIAEQKAKKLAAENQELIDRWMARKEKEADKMNEALR